MAEDKPSLHVDTDWKKQAQEEKKRLAEQEQQRKVAATAPAGVVPTAGAAAGGRAETRGAAGARQTPEASFEALVQSITTQVLFYLGELAARGGEPILNLDMARHNIDLLAMLEGKTKGNLSEAEKHLLDAALYETRMRFISVASRYAELP
jgi:hypothetical protein